MQTENTIVETPESTIETTQESKESIGSICFAHEEKDIVNITTEQSNQPEEKNDAYYENLFNSLMKKITNTETKDLITRLKEKAEKNDMDPDRKAYWDRMNDIQRQYAESAPLDFYFAQKKGEEIMEIDYNADPIKWGEWRELNEFGKEVWKNVNFLALHFEQLTDHDKECLKTFLKLENLEQVEEKINEQLKEMGEI
jgi:hypothetical protein